MKTTSWLVKPHYHGITSQVAYLLWRFLLQRALRCADPSLEDMGCRFFGWIPSGNLLHSYGKEPCLTSNVNPRLIKLLARLFNWGGTISVAIYHYLGESPKLINQGLLIRGWHKYVFSKSWPSPNLQFCVPRPNGDVINSRLCIGIALSKTKWCLFYPFLVFLYLCVPCVPSNFIQCKAVLPSYKMAQQSIYIYIIDIFTKSTINPGSIYQRSEGTGAPPCGDGGKLLNSQVVCRKMTWVRARSLPFTRRWDCGCESPNVGWYVCGREPQIMGFYRWILGYNWQLVDWLMIGGYTIQD